MNWRKLWFLPAILCVGAVAWALPGAIPGGDWIRDLATIGVFAVSGLALPSGDMQRALTAWRPSALIHLLGFVVAPGLVLLANPLLRLCGVHEDVCRGLLVTAVLPTTITSCVVCTGLAGGAVAVSMANVVLSSAIGVVLAPPLAAWLAGGSAASPAAVDPLRAMGHLALVAVLPFALGQLLRGWSRWTRVSAWCQRSGQWATQSCLLVILLVVLAASVHGGHWPETTTLVAACAAAAALHGLLLLIAWVAATPLPRADRVAVLFSAAQKSASLGAPLIAVLFARDPGAATIVATVLAYHLIQLFVDSVIAVRMDQRTAS